MIELLAGALLAAAMLAPAPAPAPLSGPPATVSAAGGAPAPVTAAAGAAAASAPAPGAAPASERRLLAVDDLYQLGEVADPRLSPEGTWVAYTVQRLDRKQDEETGDVYMVPVAGGAPLRMTAPSDKPAASPRFSPDGRHLAFLSARGGRHAQVWLLDRRGGEAQRLTDYQADVADLAWSPDSRRLALVIADPDPDQEPAAETAAGAGGQASARPPAPPKPIVIHRLQFKRDGEGYLRERRKHLHVFDLQARHSVQVTAGPYDDSEPAWSPDGKWLAFTSNRTPEPDANENTDVFVVPASPGFTPRAVSTSAGSDRSQGLLVRHQPRRRRAGAAPVAGSLGRGARLDRRAGPQRGLAPLRARRPHRVLPRRGGRQQPSRAGAGRGRRGGASGGRRAGGGGVRPGPSR
jgi:hypothetical protein